MRHSRKYQYFPYRRNWNFYRRERQGLCKVKNLKKCMKLGISREVKIKKTAFHGRGTDIFWNYNISQNEQHPGPEKIGPDYTMLISFFVYSSPRFIHPI